MNGSASRARAVVFWIAVAFLGLALVPHCGSSGYVAAAGLLGESDFSAEDRLKSLLPHQEHEEARRQIEEIRRSMRHARILAVIEVHCGLACLAQLLGVVFLIVGRRGQPVLKIVAIGLLCYAPTGAIAATLEFAGLPAWAQHLGIIALAASAAGLVLLLLSRSPRPVLISTASCTVAVP
jgi:hypothetical protein